MKRAAFTFAWLLSLGIAQAATVDIHVELNPAGSFVSSTDKIKGEAHKKGDSFEAQNIVLRIEDLKSGIDLRDRHMAEKYFEAQKYPQAVLKSASGKDGKFEGKLLVHGVEKPIEGTYTVNGGNLEAKFKTTMSAYSIPSASYHGVGAEDEVEVKVKLPFVSGN